MSNWNEMFNLIQPLNALEKLKANYFKKLTQYTKRNTIVYFSAWQQKNDSTGRFSIEDDDRNGCFVQNGCFKRARSNFAYSWW